MSKRFFSLVMILIVVCASFAQSALASAIEVSAKKSGTEGCFSYSENEDGTITIEMTDPSAEGAVTVPDEINKKPVTKISTYAFWDCVKLTEISFGSNIAQIGQMAFMNCPNLERINVAEDNGAYKSLNGVLVNGEMTTLIKCPAKIEGDFTMPDTVKTIAQYSFFDCARLTSVKLSSKLSNIPSFAFANCSSLTDIEIPETVTDIGESAFSFCSKLENINIPNKVFYVGASAFANCTSLKSVSIGKSLVFMGDLVFAGCTGIEKFEVAADNTMYSSVNGVLLSKNGKTLYNYPQCMADGTNIPDGVTKIAPYAFYGFDGAKTLIMPASLEEIGDFAFVSSAIDELIFKGEAPELGKNVFYDVSAEMTVYCTDENKLSFSASDWDGMIIKTMLKGDITADEKVNSRDIAKLQKIIAGAETAETVTEQFAADVTDDGKVNSRDIAALQKMIAA